MAMSFTMVLVLIVLPMTFCWPRSLMSSFSNLFSALIMIRHLVQMVSLPFSSREPGVLLEEIYVLPLKISLLLGKCLSKSIIPSSPWFLNLPLPTLQLISALSLAAM